MENKTNTTKKIIVATILLLVLAAITVTGIVFAYRNQSINRDFDTIIKAANVTFKFNDRTYLDELGEDDINLYKGAETDFSMEVEVSANSVLRVVVDYTIEFEIKYPEESTEIEQQKVNTLLSAIEVYELVNVGSNGEGKYGYLCMLSELENYKGNDAIISGTMATESTDEIPLRFVFSAAAGELYDELTANGDIEFAIRAKATAAVSSSTDQYVFVGSDEELVEVVEDKENVGKTIILVDDIEVSSTLRSEGIIGIDLHGKTLTLNSNLVIDCSKTAYDTALRLGVTNSRKGTGGIEGSGHISVTGLKNCYLVDNDIASGGGISGYVNINFTAENYEVIFDDLVALLKERVKSVDDGTVYINEDTQNVYGPDINRLFYDVFGYFKEFGLAIAEDSIIQNPTLLADGFIVNAIVEETSRLQFTFYIDREGKVFNSGMPNEVTVPKAIKAVGGYLTVRGSSAESIAEHVLNAIPDQISASQLLRTYDVVTGAALDWYVDDHMGGELFDSRGVYRKTGLTNLMPELKDEIGFNFKDRPADIFVKVSKSNSEIGDYNDDPAEKDDPDSLIKSDGTAGKEVNVVTVSAKERTVLLFDNVAATIGEDIRVYDINDYIEKFYYLDKLNMGDPSKTIILKNATRFEKVKLELINDPDKSPAVNKKYVELAHIKYLADGVTPEVDDKGNIVYEKCGEHEAEEGCTKDHVIKLNDEVDVPQNTLTNLMFKITFIYSDGKEYTVEKTISVSGGLAEVTKYDISYTLQSRFVGNAYTEGLGDEFYAYGALRPLVGGESVAVFVDYKLEGNARNYLSITYKFISVADLGGGYNEQIAYFTLENGAYTFIDNPGDAGLDPSEVYERKAVIQVLNSRISTVEQHTVYLTAQLYTVYYVDADGDFVGIDEAVNTFTDPSGNRILGTRDEIEDNDGKVQYIYVDPTTGVKMNPATQRIERDGKVLTFSVTLEVMGVIRNSDDNIADTQLYNIMLQIFDTPNSEGKTDRVITNKEAEDWAGALARDKMRTTRLISEYKYTETVEGVSTEYTIYYINLSGKSISSLKGIEYFKGVTGYNLDGSGIANVTTFEGLPNLQYLSFYNCAVSELAPLRYLDRLLYLNASNNKISSIEPLRYLMRLRELNISNNSVSDFDALTVSTSLRVVTVTGLKAASGSSIDSDATLVYQFALLQVNCPTVEVLFTNASGTPLRLEVGPAALVAAQVMRDLEDINRVQKTLYMPTYYYYTDKDGTVIKYQLNWLITDVEETNLTLYYNDGDPVVKYIIISPIQDKAVRLTVLVYPPEGSLDNFFFSRAFNLTLEASYDTETTYIYDNVSGRYIIAEDAIPDRALRNKLFSLFNTTVTGTTTITLEDGSTKVISNLYVLTSTELEYKAVAKSYYLDHLGIKSLKGIEYFNNALYVTAAYNYTLDLSNNDFDSEELVHLYKLNRVESLTLGGAKYDFTYLLERNVNGEIRYDNNNPNTGRAYHAAALTRLYVTGCYALEDEEILAQLYEIYCSRTTSTSSAYFVNIYITSTTTAWNPYADLLSREVSKLKSTATLSRVGDTFNIYKENGGTVPTASATTNGIPIAVYSTTARLQCSTAMAYSYYNQTFTSTTTSLTLNSSVTTYFGFYTTINSSHTGDIVYLRSFGSELTVTMRMRVQFTDRRNAAVTFDYYYIHFNIDDGGKYLDVYDKDTKEYLGTFDEVVASHELKVPALSSIYAYIRNNWASKRVTNIGALVADNFYADSGTEEYSNYRGRIAISTAMLGNASIICIVGTTPLTTITMSIYSGDYLIKGLQYFTNVTELTINTDTSFGTGVDLKNIKNLFINRASVDFSTITDDIEYALESIVINYYYYFNAYIENDADHSAFTNFKNLKTFSLTNRNTLTTTTSTYYYWVNDLTFLSAIITDNGGATPTSNLTTLTAYSISGASWGTAVATGTAMKNATVARDLYIAALANGNDASNLSYQIGTPTLHTSNYFFTAVYDGTFTAGTDDYYKDRTKWTAWAGTAIEPRIESWTTATSTEEILEIGNDFATITAYGYMRDFGLKYETSPTSSTYSYWLDDYTNTTINTTFADGLFPVAVNTEIRLPISTAIAYYGLITTNDLSTNPKIDPHRDYRIEWSIFVEYKDGNGSYELRPHETDNTLNTRTDKNSGPDGDSISYLDIVNADNLTGDTTKDLYYTYTPTQNSYVSIIGTLVLDEDVTTAYSYWYEFKVGNGDGIYVYDGNTGVKDKALRWWMFGNRNRVTDNITITGSGSYNSLRKDAQYSAAGFNGGTTTLTPLPAACGSYLSGTTIYYDTTYQEYKHITDLYGIGDVVKHWKNVRAVGKVPAGVAVHNGIADIKTFSHIYAKFDNGDISPLYDFTELTTLTLTGYNSISTTYRYYHGYAKLTGTAGTPSISGQLVKLETLDLRYNYSITPDDIALLAEPCAGGKRALKSLNINSTRCMNSYEPMDGVSEGSMLDIIEKLIKNTVSGSISLSLNNATLDTVTVTDIENIRTTVNPANRYNSGINSGSDIYKSTAASMAQTISADTSSGIYFQFIYTVSSNMTTYIKNYSQLVSNKIDVRMQVTISDTSYRQFTGIYVNTHFDRGGDVLIESKMGREQNDVNDFDTELIAYLFVKYNSNMVKSYDDVTGNYYYTFNYTSSIIFNSVTATDLAYLASLRTLENSHLLYASAGYSFSVAPTYYYNLSTYALAYKHTTYTIEGAQNINPNATYRAFVNPTSALIYHGIVKNAFTFLEGSQPSYQAQLPNYIMFKGVTCPIGYCIATTTSSPSGLKTYYSYSTGATGLTTLLPPYSYTSVTEVGDNFDKPLETLYTDDDGNTFFRVNKKTVPPTGASTAFDLVVIIKKTITSTTAADRYVYTTRRITLTRITDPLITNTSLNLIEVDIEDVDADMAGDEAVIKHVANGGNDYIVGSADLANKIYRVTNGTTIRHYNYVPSLVANDTLDEVWVVDASQVFPSSWLVRYMFLSYYNATTYGLTGLDGSPIDLKDATHTVYRENDVTHANNETYGFIMRTADIKNLAGLDVRYSTGTGSNATFTTRVTSISGIEIFQNMTSLLLRGGMVTDISPIENMHLKTFYYDNSRDYGGANTSIQTGITDFMPLVRGSSTSLEYFTYNAGTTQITDMSFLLAFTNQNLMIYICSDDVLQRFAYTDSGANTTTDSASYRTYSYNGLSYFMTSQGRTVINLLQQRGINIYTNTATYSAYYHANTNYVTGRMPLTYDGSTLISGTGLGNLAGQNVYAIRTSDREAFAADVLVDIKNNIEGVTYSDDFLMTVDTSKFQSDTTTIDLGGGDTKTVLESVSFQMDATIVAGSGYYIIDWESASRSIQVRGIHLTGDLTVTLDDGTVKEFKAFNDITGEYNMLTDEEIEIISDSIDYYNAQKAGLTKLVTEFTVYALHEIEMMDDGGEWVIKDNGLLDLSGRAVCRVNFNGYTYDRGFYFEFI